MKFKFDNLNELLEILNSPEEESAPISAPDYVIKREAFISGLGEEAVLEKLDKRIAVSRASLIKGLTIPQFSSSGLTRGAAAAFYNSEKKLMDDGLFRRSISYALAINEVNAAGGKIVAFPTAGSSGIVSGAIWAWWDVKNKAPFVPVPEEEPFPNELRDAFLVSSLAGMLIAQKATLAGAEGGCQAECGSAAAMAACALAYLEKLPLEDCFSAAALSLKNSLGLACDPVAGLVEVPCVKRNAFFAVNAVLAVDMSLAGIRSIIPFDDVVLAMKDIASSMPANIRENAMGGLAATPTGKKIKEELSGTELPNKQ